jgi:hypothetical protein
VPSLPDAESAARLVNAGLPGADGLRGLLVAGGDPGEVVGDGHLQRLRAFVAELRPVFEAGDSGDARTVVDRLNRLLSDRQVVPQVVPGDHPGVDPGDQPGDQPRGRLDEKPGWRLQAQTDAGDAVDRLAAESLLGLAALVCELGPTRLGVCHAPGCSGVFVDTSPNRSRRYCSERCSSRTNVAAYRARQRLVHQARTAG